MKRFRKAGVAVAAVATTLALGTVMVSATGDADDHYGGVAAGTQLVGVATGLPSQCPAPGRPTGTVTCFSVPGKAPTLTVYCKFSTSGDKMPAATAPLGFNNLNQLPVFSDGGTKPCTDSLGGSDTSKVTQGTNGHLWATQENDKLSDEATAEPNATGDTMQVRVPQGSVVVTTSQGCKITVSPSGDSLVGGAYNDAGVFHVATTTLAVSIAKLSNSCPLPVTASVMTTFYAIYVFHAGTASGPVAKVFDKG